MGLPKPYYDKNGITIYHGDCREILPHLPKVDLVLTDPPYGITSCKWDAIIPLNEMWAGVDSAIRENGVIALMASQPFSSVLVMSRPEMFKHEWIWIKNRGSNFANTVREPMKEHEYVLIFSVGGWTYNKQMQERTGGGASRVQYNFDFESKSENYREFEGRKGQKRPKLRVPSSWQKFNTEVGLHPTQKPVELMAYMIKTYTNEGDTVLDFAMGSGTTLVATQALNRKAIGIEIEEKYCEIAVKRLSQEVFDFEAALQKEE